MWEAAAREVESMGGVILNDLQVEEVRVASGEVRGIVARSARNGKTQLLEGDYYLSTMPVQDLLGAIRGEPPPDRVRRAGEGLQYRDLLAVGLLLSTRNFGESHGRDGERAAECHWIYVQEPDARVGRVQLFNNWSPYLAADREKLWLGAEYFCAENDDLWRRPDAAVIRFAVEDMSRAGLISRNDVLDGVVIRARKAYPSYAGAYREFGAVRECLDGIRNLILIGRNGMHRYNNMDHSMLSAMAAVDGIQAGEIDRAAIWSVNAEPERREPPSAL
jgi:protoporphyrinogen oxidase